MASVVVDTHAIIWYLTADPRLSRPALAAMDAATADGDPIHVSAISLVEVLYLAEKGRLPARDRELLLDALEIPNSRRVSLLWIAPFWT